MKGTEEDKDVQSLIYISYSKQPKIKLVPETALVKACPSFILFLVTFIAGP